MSQCCRPNSSSACGRASHPLNIRKFECETISYSVRIRYAASSPDVATHSRPPSWANYCGDKCLPAESMSSSGTGKRPHDAVHEIVTEFRIFVANCSQLLAVNSDQLRVNRNYSS